MSSRRGMPRLRPCRPVDRACAPSSALLRESRHPDCIRDSVKALHPASWLEPACPAERPAPDHSVLLLYSTSLLRRTAAFSVPLLTIRWECLLYLYCRA